MKNTSKEDRFKKFVESIDGIAWEADAKTLEFLYVSPQSKSMLGYDPEEWYNTTFWQSIIHSEDRTNATRFCHEKTKAGEDHTFEYRILKSNGDVIWVRDIVTVQKENGEAHRLSGLLIDITEEKCEIEKSQRLLNDAYNLADIGHWELDLIDSKLFWSTSVRKLHEVEDSFVPTIDKAIAFYTEDDREIVTKVVSQAIESGESFDEELKIITQKGNKRWVRIVGDAEFRNGECIRVYGSTQNITKRKQMEIQLQETDQKLDDIVKHSTNLFYRHDENHVLTYASPQFEKLLGYGPGEILKNWVNLTTDHPSNEIGYEFTQRAIDTGKAQPQYELQLKKKTGEHVWVRVNEAPVVENGKTVAIVGSLTNITDSKNYEEKLEQLSLVASKTTDIIIITNNERKIRWVNKAFTKLTGYTLEDSIGKKPGHFLQGPETNPDTVARIRKKLNNNESVQEVILNYSKTGKKYWLDMTIDPILDDDGDCVGYIAIEKDVSSHVERENALRDNIKRYDTVAKATSDTIWDLDLINDRIQYNGNIHTMFGYTEQEVQTVGTWWRDKIHPDDLHIINSQIDDALNNDKDRLQLEYRFKAACDEYKHVYDRAFIIRDDDNVPVRMIGAMQDVTRQKEEEQWLKLLESAIANSTEAIAILDAKPDVESLNGRKIQYINKAFTEMTGFTKDEVIGNTLYVLKGEKTDQNILDKLSDSMTKWEPAQVEFVNYKKDGTPFWIYVSMAPVKNANGDYSHWVFVGRDITSRINHEKEISESLKEKETLLVEIHHRVKNNLAVVSSLMLMQALEEENEDVTRKLYDSVVRIKAMATIHELLYNSKSFSNLEFSENVKILTNNIIETISTDTEIDVKLNCNPVQLNVNQAIPCSLILNEVITNTIKHAYNGRENGMLYISLNENEGDVSLSIKDDGVGMPDKFGDLKETSVGLHLIDVLCKQLDASYTYNSNGKGTDFRITFSKNDLKGVGNAYL